MAVVLTSGAHHQSAAVVLGRANQKVKGRGFEGGGPRPGSESGEKGEVSFGVNTYEHIYGYIYMAHGIHLCCFF